MGTAPPPASKKNWIIEHHGISRTYTTDEEPLFPARLSEISRATSNLPGRRRCIAFTTGGHIDFVYLAPDLNDDSDEDMFEVSSIFPNSAASVRATNIPGTLFRLNEDFRIIVSRSIEYSPPNASIQHLFSTEWSGNIVVAKYNTEGNTVDINATEFQFVIAFLGMWIYNIKTMERGLAAPVSRS